MAKPKYMDKHPCEGCGCGYGECAQFAAMSMKCCVDCEHPTRWVADPWTAEDLAEMDARRAQMQGM